MPVVPEPLREWNGAMLMRVVIGEDGGVHDLCIISGPEILRSYYVDAIKQWKYRPFLKEGKPVPVQTLIALTIQYGGMKLPEGRVHIASGVMAGRVAKRVMPIFKPIPQPELIHGTAVIHVIVGRDGRVLETHFVSGPGDDEVHKQILAAVQQWEYQPYLEGGKPTEVDTTVILPFVVGDPGW